MSEKQDIRLTQTTLRVLEVFMSDITKEISGADIWSATKIGAGSRYPILARLENAGWLISHWEKIDSSEQGRPRRRYYRLTSLGQSRAHAALLDRGFGGECQHGAGNLYYSNSPKCRPHSSIADG